MYYIYIYISFNQEAAREYKAAVLADRDRQARLAAPPRAPAAAAAAAAADPPAGPQRRRPGVPLDVGGGGFPAPRAAA
jgi:hypothetical protein